MTKNKKSILKKLNHEAKKEHINRIKKGFNDEMIIVGHNDKASKLGSISLNGNYYLSYVTYRSRDIAKTAPFDFEGLKPHIIYLNNNNLVVDGELVKELSKRLLDKYGEEDLDNKIEKHFKSVLVDGLTSNIANPYKKQLELDKKQSQ